MAARSRLPIGSAPWVLAEQREVAGMISQEVEEFQFSVQNEMEWLNEHMASIFAPGNLNVADVFKTPGKLRGKTPRTARKQAAANRAPLTDIFAPNLAPSSPAKALGIKSPPPARIFEDVENQYSRPVSPSKNKGPVVVQTAVFEDAMEVDATTQNNEVTRPTTQNTANHLTVTVPLDGEPRNRRTTTDSFVSARENLTSRLATEEPVSQPEVVEAVEPMQVDKQVVETIESTQQTAVNDVEMMDDDDLRSPSDGSSPIKAVFRKSSLNFASLPAREPLAKTSIGARNSQFEKKSFGSFSRPTTVGPRVTGFSNATADADKLSMDSSDKAMSTQSTQLSSQDTLVNKTSTQLLADKISMLGQSSNRTSHLVASFEKISYPTLSQQTDKTFEPVETQKVYDVVMDNGDDDDDDEWIAPIKKPAAIPRPISEISISKHQPASIKPIKADQEELQPSYGSPARPLLYKKMASTTVLESATKAAMAPDPSTQKPISVSNPTFVAGTTTPPASPPRSPGGRKMLDGPLSASKAKFYSVLKSAKGIFASSAGVSANAKLEALSPGRVRKQAEDAPPSPTADVHPKPALFPNKLSKSTRPASPDARRLRSSTEQRRKEEEERRRAADDLDMARQKERQKAAEAAALKMNRAPPPHKSNVARPAAVSRQESELSKTDDVPPPVPPKTMLPSSKIRDPRKVVPLPRAAPPKDAATAAKVKPAPVTVRMPSQRIGQAPPSTATLSQSLHETLPPPPPPKTAPTKPQGLTKHANASTTSLKSTASAKRAMTAAAKKKDEETKLAQRKAEQKKDFEQKRAQRLEEERKLEQQRRAAEAARMQEARKAAQRQAEEVKRKEPPRPESRAMNERPTAPQSHQQPPRPVSRMDMVPGSNRPVPQMNQAKVPKRALPADAEEHGPHRPAAPHSQPYQQLDAKRRKTDEEEQEPLPQRTSVLAPPIRQSTVKKDTSKFTHAYTPSQNKSMFIKTVTSQHQLQHSAKQNEMAKFANGRIPFADPTPSATLSQTPASQSYKTPARPAAHGPSQPNTAAKSSPRYPASELIELPEIMTDSEDEDSENEFQAPSWTASPALRQLLSNQQLVDPESIFGPVAPIEMDKVFAGSKRENKFRDRTSSAHWSHLDKLNEEERKKDRKARERLMRDGGWDFVSQKAALGDNSPRP